MIDFTELIDLVGEKLGGVVEMIFVSGEKVYENGRFADNPIGKLLIR